MKNMYDAIVIGGGIQGCSVAYNLALNNLKVLVIEKDYCGRHASGANAGGVRRLGRDYREIELAEFSTREYWHKIDTILDHDCEFHKSNGVKIAMDEKAMQTNVDRVEQVKAMGFNHEQIIDYKSLKEMLPEVSENALGALYVEGDGHANPFKTTNALKQKAIKCGAIVKEREEVTSIEGDDKGWSVTTNSGKYTSKYIVNSAGAWGARIAKFFEENIPFNESCSMLSITEKTDVWLKPVVGFLGRTLSLKQFDNGTMLIGGGFKGILDIENNKASVDFSKVGENVRNANEIFDRLKDLRIIRSWAGIEGACMDNIPVISKSTKYETVFHNFGYSFHGFQPAFGSGKVLSEMMLDQKLSVSNMHEFKIDRFM